MISIIIPIYNVEKYLDTCLDTVVNQTYRDIEIILVDDGAKDNSGVIADNWANKDQRIKVIHQENGGLSKARNTGIKAASGQYLIFVDSDDVVALNMVERLYELVVEHQAQIAIADAQHIFGERKEYRAAGQIKVYTNLEAIREMWYQNSFLPSAWGKIYQKELFEGVQYKEGIIFEDVEVMHRLFYQCSKIVYSTEELYGYVHHEASITTNPFSQKDLVILDICDQILDFSRDKPEISRAAKHYYIVGALRVYLNALPEMAQARQEAQQRLAKYGKTVLHDENIRKKTKYALWLYFYCRPLLRPVYRRINRWK